MSAPPGWEEDLKLRDRLQEQSDARTPADWARLGLSTCAELAAHHERHFPGDPLKALRNLVDTAQDHVARAEQAGGFEHVGGPIGRVINAAKGTTT